jgi:hypothetical protein
MQLDARGAFRRPPTARRPLRESDAVWLRVNLRQARGLRGPKDRPNRFDIVVGLPARKGEPVPVRVFRPRLRPEETEGLRAELLRGGAQRRLLVRIPWSLLRVAPPKGTAALGIDFALLCPGRGAQPSWRLAWGGPAKPTLLLAK